MGLSRPLSPGKWMAISPLRLRWFCDWHNLQDISVTVDATGLVCLWIDFVVSDRRGIEGRPRYNRERREWQRRRKGRTNHTMSHRLTSKKTFGSPPQETLAARVQKLLISVKEMYAAFLIETECHQSF